MLSSLRDEFILLPRRLSEMRILLLLFELKDVDEWMVVGDNIILISDGIVYNYSDNTGLRMILESNELKYNYKNIYNYWKKD